MQVNFFFHTLFRSLFSYHHTGQILHVKKIIHIRLNTGVMYNTSTCI